MKTSIHSISSKALILGLCVCMAALASCAGNQKKTNEESKGGAEVSVSAPEMDLHTAVVTGDMGVVKGHIAAGSDLDIQEPTAGSSPLITAAVFNKVDMVRALLEGGANVNYQNQEGSTALHTAAFLCRQEIVEVLLAHGADKSLKNIYGSTAWLSVAGPYEDVAPIYDEFRKGLGPLGLRLEDSYLRETRPVIAELLK